MITEADTCRKYVLPKLLEAGWDRVPHSFTEQKTFTDGRIVVTGSAAAKPKVKRRPQKRADYLLRYTPDLMIAAVEAKARYRSPGEGLQQAKAYAQILDLPFAYATNGHGIIEFDFLTGQESVLNTFPSPQALWARWSAAKGLDGVGEQHLLSPLFRLNSREPRYYQEIAINRVVEAILKGRRRILVTMATGTGKTLVAFQICWKLWEGRWNRTGEPRRPKILYLADRNILVDDPRNREFAPFGEARIKIENGQATKSRDLYFSIYQAMAQDERRPGLYKEYTRDFFDLVIVDECHRGSARETSNWREILEYFEPAYQLGLTATPIRDDNADSYRYFGDPIYSYSLRQGIEDGFLAPYRVHRVSTTPDAIGWRPSTSDLDRYGRRIPDEEYRTKDFERSIALLARTKAIARHLTDFLKSTNRFAKTIVFCVDQEHADEMRRELNNLNSDLVKQHPDYVCRVTADEGLIGRGHLSRFQDVESKTPVILTTSQLLTTGVDAPTCQNVVLARVIGSMTEFKQIIGRGTRVYVDADKFFFNILDYTGSATRLFADPAFDGDPSLLTSVELNANGEEIASSEEVPATDGEGEVEVTVGQASLQDDDEGEPRKFYFDGGQVEIVAHLVYELDADGAQLRVVRYSDYAGNRVRTLYPSIIDLRNQWADPQGRSTVIEALEERGITFEELAAAANQPEADPFDLLCHLAFNAPLRTRRERADRLRQEKQDFFDQFGAEARDVLNALLDKYAEHGTTQWKFPDALKVPPLAQMGNVMEIARYFGGADKMKQAVNSLQSLLYAA